MAGLTITAWRLWHVSGACARCLIGERDRRWHLFVWHKDTIVYCERYDSDDAALARADELWQALVKAGWSPHPFHDVAAFRRLCTQCGTRAGTVVRRQQRFLILLCSGCRHEWLARERGASVDRRQAPRSDERRQDPPEGSSLGN